MLVRICSCIVISGCVVSSTQGVSERASANVIRKVWRIGNDAALILVKRAFIRYCQVCFVNLRIVWYAVLILSIIVAERNCAVGILKVGVIADCMDPSNTHQFVPRRRRAGIASVKMCFKAKAGAGTGVVEVSFALTSCMGGATDNVRASNFR